MDPSRGGRVSARIAGSLRSPSSTRARTIVLVVALLVRLVPVLATDRVTVDVLRYRRVAEQVLDVSWNPYQAPRLYPYPPVWVWIEAGSEWLARRGVLSFAVLVKLPVVAADLLIVALLARMGPDRGLGLGPAWLYAVHPVSVLITGFHGQFDAIPLLFVLLALDCHDRGRNNGSALALAGGIATKSFPVLLLPFFLAKAASRAAAARFLLLATAPVALLLLPYALDDLPALRRELFGYSGIADFGWIALLRGLRWLGTGILERSEPRYWGPLAFASKALFLASYGAMLLAFGKGRLRWSLPQAALAVFVAFQALYGLISAQYLLWVAPLGALFMDRHVFRHAAAATVALLGFYAFLHPTILQGEDSVLRYPTVYAGLLWVAGVAAVLYVVLLWLESLLRRGLTRGE